MRERCNNFLSPLICAQGENVGEYAHKEIKTSSFPRNVFNISVGSKSCALIPRREDNETRLMTIHTTHPVRFYHGHDRVISASG